MPTPLCRLLSRDWSRPCQAALLGVAVAGVVAALLAAMPARAQDDGSGSQGQTIQADLPAQVDPPSQVARLSVVEGNVSVEPASVNQFSAAEVNYPLTTGDRLYADVGANAELQTDQLAIRLGQQTDLTVTAMTDTLAQFGLASGSAHLRSFSLDPNATVELDTPNVAVTVLQPGDVRVDVDPDSDTTIVTVDSGQVEVDGNGLQQVMEAGQGVRLVGSNPVTAQWMDAAETDGLDRFSGDRDDLYQSSVASEGQYVNPDTIGAEDLGANGDWETESDAGPVWYPTGVAVGWQPYSCGRWAWVAPWGWTWVGCEPWGFAPFHYGRWQQRGGRWGWIPGPPVVRPIYSPALVVFVGVDRLNPGGGPVTAWFPLGPREAYVPWYHASQRYVNRVNVSNIYDRDTVQVRNIYNQRTEVSAYAAAGQHGYVNRPTATIAVSQASFAAGKRVGQSTVQVNAEVLAAAPVLPHPLVTPQRAMIVAAPTRAVPERAARPTLASTQSDERVRSVGQPPAQPSYQHDAAPIARQPADGVRPQPEPTRMAPPPMQRSLYNRAVPPAPRPSFDQQQRAIQSVDPGRPLGPQQMNNLRQNEPVGQPQQREMPHPAPRPMPAPAPRSAPPASPRR
jgi:hypothetical protein